MTTLPFVFAPAIALVALVILYLVIPRFRTIRLSAKRFVVPKPVKPPVARRFRLESLFLSASFWIQFGALVLAALALLSSAFRVGSPASQQRIGLLVLVDSSGSMTTLQQGEERIAFARREVARALDMIRDKDDSQAEPCVTLAAFDMEVRELLTGATASAARAPIDALSPRALGTDLGALRLWVENRLMPDRSDTCPINQVLVVSDMPDPAWAPSPGRPVVLWRDIAQAVENEGLVQVRRLGGASFATTGTLAIDMAAYLPRDLAARGVAPRDTKLQVTDSLGTIQLEQAVRWNEGRARVEFLPQRDGVYTFTIVPGGDYGLDDRLTAVVSDVRSLRVDWRHTDITFLSVLTRQLGWVEDKNSPDLRVEAYPGQSGSTVPTLLIGNGYDSSRGDTTRTGFFYEDSPLLDKLDLRVAERAGIRGVNEEQSPSLTRVLVGKSPTANLWLAQRERPRAALVPGFPVSGSEDVTNFSLTAFFNGLRWLLSSRQAPPLYTLTSPAQPLPAQGRAVLHPGEGNTAQQPQSSGELTDLETRPSEDAQSSFWRVLVAAMMGVLVLERGLTLFGGSRWR